MSTNEREEQILRMAFEQRGVKVVISKPTYQNYVLTLQYLPDVIMMELPRICTEQVHFSSLIHKHKRTKSIPIIGYGDKIDSMVMSGIAKQGISYYLERPLKFTSIIALVEKLMNQANKKVDLKAETNDKEKDIELILSSSALPTQKIDAMTRHVSTLMAFPFTVAKVLHITQDEKSGASDLAQAIHADPAITTHLLKVSNSVFFASVNRRITSIKDAIVRIGYTETKKIVMSMTVMKIFDQKNRNSGFDRIDFWYHSLASAIISENVAKFIGSINIEEAFLAGLLHDLGIIMLDEFYPTIFEKVLAHTSQTGGHFIDCETEMLGINHNDVIMSLFPRWKIPQEITDAITGQFSIAEYKSGLDTPGKKLAACVAIGNSLSKVLHLGRQCDDYVVPVENYIFRHIRMGNGFTRGFIEQVYQSIELFRRFLQLEQREYPREFQGLSIAAELKILFVNMAESVFIPPFLYLEKEGYGIELIPHNPLVSSFDSKYDIVMVWAGGSMTRKDMDMYFHIVGKPSGEGPSMPAQPEKVEFAPVLVFAPEGSALMKECCEKVSLLRTSLDMRQIDKAINDMLSGKIVVPVKSTGKARKAGAPEDPVGKAVEPEKSAGPDTGNEKNEALDGAAEVTA